MVSKLRPQSLALIVQVKSGVPSPEIHVEFRIPRCDVQFKAPALESKLHVSELSAH